MQLSSVVFLKADLPSLSVACAGSSRSASGGGLQLLPGVLLSDGCPPLNVAGAGSIRPTSWGFAAVVRCCLEVDLPSLSVACAGSSRSTSAVARCLSER